MVEISPIFGRGPRISASAYTGRAVAPMAVDAAETNTLITKNSLQLGIVANQIQGMTAQMQSLAGSLSVIARNLQVSQTLQRQKEQQEIDLERRLAEQKLREGKESTIEKKIQAAALAPAQRLATKAQFTLGRLQNFFVSIFGGWLLNQGIQTLQALSGNNKEKLEEIKNNVLKNLVIIGGTMAAVKLGIGAILGTFSLLGVKLLAIAAVGLFTKPGRQLLAFVSDALKIAANGIASFIGREPPFPDAGKLKSDDDPSPSPAPSPNNNPEPPNEVNTDPDPVSNSNPEMEGKSTNQWWDFMDLFLDPGEENPPETSSNTENGDQSANLEGKGGPSSSIQSLQNSADLSANIATDIMSSMLPKNDKSEGPEPPGPTKEAESGLVKITADFGSGEVDLNKPVGSEGQIGKKVLDPETTEYIAQEKYIGKYGKLPPSMLQSSSKSQEVAKRVSQPPQEPGVTVVPLATGSGESKQSAATPAASGSIASVKMYPTSNDDNMYTLGAKSNFNVVSV